MISWHQYINRLAFIDKPCVHNSCCILIQDKSSLQHLWRAEIGFWCWLFVCVYLFVISWWESERLSTHILVHIVKCIWHLLETFENCFVDLSSQNGFELNRTMICWFSYVLFIDWNSQRYIVKSFAGFPQPLTLNNLCSLDKCVHLQCCV